MGQDSGVVDLLVIGGGINGAGIARDAAGRGLSVTLVEQGDLASATSSWSSKLIHGGLRYLEQYEFRLVREALQEREVLLRIAPHIIRPLMFVLPHDPSMRPAWMIKAGLWMYDRLGGPITLPRSKAVAFPHMEFSPGLKPSLRAGFVYSDCRVDDSRLTVLNAVSAREKGAVVLTRTRFESARRVGAEWEAVISGAPGERRTLRARGIVNTAGPWVVDVLDRIEGDRITDRVRLVKGSHIVVPKVHSQGHALILQNPDKRVVFVIPYEGAYSLIGTTDVSVTSVEDSADITAEETDYLVGAANRFLAKPIAAQDVVWSYAGVRPLYDDGTANPSQVTRDYVLKVDEEAGRAPLLTVFGGKITTYRRLAEEAMDKLKRFFPAARGDWTGTEELPGGDVGHFNAFRDAMHARYPQVGRDLVEGIVRRHGSRAPKILRDARFAEGLGRNFGGGLTQHEVEYLVAEEWAATAEDVLWRRTKCGLHMSAQQRESVAAFMQSGK
ncbi:MAG TPA: glycerol-3-phosphate dehydrogenase [Usitatibacter sp.]|nr:glycerol-3-phosphate dehydrogenase [Usitatibacter sp.]